MSRLLDQQQRVAERTKQDRHAESGGIISEMTGEGDTIDTRLRRQLLKKERLAASLYFHGKEGFKGTTGGFLVGELDAICAF